MFRKMGDAADFLVGLVLSLKNTDSHRYAQIAESRSSVFICEQKITAPFHLIRGRNAQFLFIRRIFPEDLFLTGFLTLR
jgi:hypothetical protein